MGNKKSYSTAEKATNLTKERRKSYSAVEKAPTLTKKVDKVTQQRRKQQIRQRKEKLLSRGKSPDSDEENQKK